MRDAVRRIKLLPAALAVLAFLFLAGTSGTARAVDLPMADSSPLTGIQFNDKPLILPVQRNFQMAMLTSSSELGRSCGNMEAYGWRMGQNEQGRVNQIFNNTTERLRSLGFTVAPQKLSSVSSDVTLFTADKPDQHFIFLWSAGELGLVMTLCESTAPVATSYRPAQGVPSVQVFPVPGDMAASHADAQTRLPVSESDNGFTPLGEWHGGYTCGQGYTGGSIQITHLSGKDFEGIFKFFPTPKNPDVHAGAYYIYGQYDRASHRILINPGKWIERPPHYFNTVIVGGFNPAHDSFSGYFQGISGCTSFEALRVGKAYPDFGAHGRKAIERDGKTPFKKPLHKPVRAPAHKAVRRAHSAPIKPAAVHQVPLSAIMTPAPATAAAPATTAPAPTTTATAIAPAATAAAAPATTAPAPTAPAAATTTAAPSSASGNAAPMIDTPTIPPADAAKAKPSPADNGIAVTSPGK